VHTVAVGRDGPADRHPAQRGGIDGRVRQVVVSSAMPHMKNFGPRGIIECGVVEKGTDDSSATAAGSCASSSPLQICFGAGAWIPRRARVRAARGTVLVGVWRHFATIPPGSHTLVLIAALRRQPADGARVPQVAERARRLRARASVDGWPRRPRALRARLTSITPALLRRFGWANGLKEQRLSRTTQRARSGPGSR